MNPSVGQRLHAAREHRGLAIQDVIHETRISKKVIHALEEDDYSDFSNVVYAKSFLSMYAGYLEVDVSDALSQFVVHDGYESLEPRFGDSAEGIPNRLRPAKDLARPRMTPVALFLMLLAMVATIPTVYYMGRESDDGLVRAAPVARETNPGDQAKSGAAGDPGQPESEEDSRPALVENSPHDAESPILPARRIKSVGQARGGNASASPSFQARSDSGPRGGTVPPAQ